MTRFVLTLEGKDDRPAPLGVRLGRLLTVILPALGFRLVSVTEADDATDATLHLKRPDNPTAKKRDSLTQPHTLKGASG